MSLAVLGGRAKEAARRAEAACGGLEVLEDVLDERGLGGCAVGAAHEVAAEGAGGGEAGPPDLEAAAGGDDRVLLRLHRLVEEGRVGGRHVLHGGHDRGQLWVVLWHVATGSGAHVAVLCLPRLEPVGADRAERAVCCDLVQVELDNERVKVVDDVGAAGDGAGQVVLAW